jgi:CHAT domain-containing protein
VVHISSHFRFHAGDESHSFLLLGDGQVMTLAEMKEHENLFQGVELLTLSACDTAAQRPDSTGREVDAFAELAQRLGASGVMASLWAVRDRSAAQLMIGFYRNREGGKLTKAGALRKAQLDLLYERNEVPLSPSVSMKSPTTNQDDKTIRRGGSTDEDVIVEAKYRIPFKVNKSKPFAHPYYWSPFVLFGNWK